MMKGKKLLALLMAALMTAALFAGCGATSSENAAADYAAPQEMKEEEAPAVEEGLYSSSSSVTADQSTVTEQKLIKRVNIDAETEDLEALLPKLTNKIAELGGYIESQELYNGNTYSSYRSRSVNMTVRIPAERLSEFTAQVEGESNVVNYSETADDVTLQYVDTESRIKALEVEQERLLEQAQTMTDLLEIEERLTDVRYELESYESQLRTLQNKVNYATVYLYISQVKVYTEVEPQTVWQRIGSGFSGNLRDIGENLTDFFVWIVTYSPQLIFWAAVITVAVLLIRRRVNRKRKGSQTQEDSEKKE